MVNDKKRQVNIMVNISSTLSLLCLYLIEQKGPVNFVPVQLQRLSFIQFPVLHDGSHFGM